MNSFPSYHDISYFLEVAKNGNLTRAAECIGITQPTLSQAMKRLESQMDAHLLVRRREGVELTPAGERLRRQGEQFLLNWESLRDAVQGDEGDVSGHFRIGCHPSVALYILDQCLPGLMTNFAKIHIELVHNLSRKIVSGILSREIDYGLVINPIPHPELVLKALSTDKVCFWVGGNFPEQNSDVLIYDPNLKQSQQLIQKLPPESNTFRRHLHSDHHEVIRGLIEKGVGVGILPEKVARLAREPLKLRDEKWPQHPDQLYLAFRADCIRSQAHKEIVKSLSLL